MQGHHKNGRHGFVPPMHGCIRFMQPTQGFILGFNIAGPSDLIRSIRGKVVNFRIPARRSLSQRFWLALPRLRHVSQRFWLTPSRLRANREDQIPAPPRRFPAISQSRLAPTRRPTRDCADSLRCDGEAFVHGENKPQTPKAVTDTKVGTFSSVADRTVAQPRAAPR